MKAIMTALLLTGALSFTSCAHKGHHHKGRAKAGQSCCKDKADCKDGSCKLKKKGEKIEACCSGDQE